MDESTAGRNASTSIVQPATSSLLVFVVINSTATLLCAFLTAFCVAVGLGLVRYERRLQHLLTSRLAAAASVLWSFEDDVERLLRFAEQLRSRVILHGVTEFDLLAYKFRVENGVYGYRDAEPHQSFVTLKKLEHLLEAVAIHLPRRRRWWALRQSGGYGGLTLGSTVCRVAVATAPVWCDDTAQAVRLVINYVAGQRAAAQFDADRPSDSVVERRVLATVSYVRSLRLVDDRFFLATPVGDVQLRDKITEVDRRLTVGGGLSFAVLCPAALLDAYTALRQLCVDVGLARWGDAELPERMTSATAAVPVLRHLVRLSCGTTTAVRRTEPDARFSSLMTRLHDQLVASVDAAAVRASERWRDGTLAVMTALRSTLTSLDPDFTKTTLEHVERQLCRHINHLAVAQRTTTVLPQPLATEHEPVAGPSGLQATTRLVVSMEEESSGPSGQYATAASLSSLEPEEQQVPMSSFFRAANGDDNEYLETAI